ncbi:hypothetical protein OROHE_006793 [Orobanche hederae]
MRNPFSLSILLFGHLLIYLTDGHGKTMKLAFADSNVYIVYLGERQHNDSELVKDSHHAMLTSLMGSKQLALESMVYSYRHGFSGFAAKLTESQAQQLSEHPDVVQVMQNSFYKLKTTRSWDYLGVSPKIPTNLLDESRKGDRVIIGVLDTGIWPAVTSYASSLVRSAGGVGVIVSKLPNEITSRCRNFPCAEVDYEVGTQILSYIRSTRNPMAKLSLPTTLMGKDVSAKIAGFSSRGPNSIAASILKPDIAAPGVQIIAASSDVDTSAEQGFTMLTGTSMATPHIAGIVALLKAQHPDWSPAAIRSALTTTAWTRDPYDIPVFAEAHPYKLADPFDFGGGIANPNGAACPGLIYDMDTTDYINYLCAMGYSSSAISQQTGQPVMCPTKTVSILDVNLPSITVPYLRNSTTLTRRVTNIGGSVNTIYRAVIDAPAGTFVFVFPPILFFSCDIKEISFKVTITSMHHQLNAGYSFGSLTWTDGVHKVRSPISVRTAMPQN